MSGFLGLLILILIAGWATTYIWRFAGVYLAERTNPDSEILVWVRAVATALVAALVARILFAPPGVLATTSLDARIAAMACGVAAFYLFRRQTGAGVAAAVASLLILVWMLDT